MMTRFFVLVSPAQRAQADDLLFSAGLGSNTFMLTFPAVVDPYAAPPAPTCYAAAFQVDDAQIAAITATLSVLSSVRWYPALEAGLPDADVMISDALCAVRDPLAGEQVTLQGAAICYLRVA